MSEILNSSEKQPGISIGEVDNHLLAEKLNAAKKSERLDALNARNLVEKAGPISKEATAGHLEKDSSRPSDVSWWSKELGDMSFKQTLSSIRRHLSKPEVRLSKMIHQPIIEKASEFGAKTVARPSGILFGGIFSFTASLGTYLLAKRLGGELKFSVFVITFVVGYIFGLIIELTWRSLRRGHSS